LKYRRFFNGDTFYNTISVVQTLYVVGIRNFYLTLKNLNYVPASKSSSKHWKFLPEQSKVFSGEGNSVYFT